MVGGLLALMMSSAAQPSAAPMEDRLVCSLVTPGGDEVEFRALSTGTDRMQLALATSTRTIWPRQTIIGNRRGGPDRGTFVFGAADGAELEFSQPSGVERDRSVTLYGRAGGRLPLAFGFCRPLPRDAVLVNRPQVLEDGAASIAGVAAFDPGNWADRCALMLSDGRRLELIYRITPPSQLEIASPSLWDGRPTSATIGWARRGGRQIGVFERRNGPRGTEIFVVQQNRGRARGVKLIRFVELGDPASPGQGGYAICGYDGMTRGAGPR